MANRPNVVFFFTDQQRADSTGVHGCPLDLTPNFDRIAQRGTHLYNAFTPQPVCGPARSCLQSGMYATRVGCWRNGIPLPQNIPTLAKSFNAAGYRTGYFGKWHLASDEAIGPVVPEQRGGYTDWLASNVLEFTSDGYQTTLWDERMQPVELPGYRVDAVTDAVIRHIDAQASAARTGERPFFTFVSHIEPHHQNHVDDYVAPDGYRERYTGRWTPPDLLHGGSAAHHLGGYFGCIRRLDEAFGRLLDALKTLKLLDNTIVVFTSDHGCHFKTRNAEYKRSCHEASIRVPCAISGPGFDGGGRVQKLVSLLDLPPTLLDACGVDVPSTMQGRSVLPLVHGRDPGDWPAEVFVQISESQVGRAIRTSRWKYAVRDPDVDGWKATSSARYVEDFLYDLQHDPHEQNNLVGRKSHRALADRLQQRLIARMRQAGEEVPTIVNAPETPAGQRKVSAEEIEL